jgi:hypothetical protein
MVIASYINVGVLEVEMVQLCARNLLTSFGKACAYRQETAAEPVLSGLIWLS